MAGRPYFAALFLMPLALGACEKRGGNTDAGTAATTAAANTTSVPCALHGTDVFQTNCPVERIISADGLVLVVHHPDGGFRKLLVTTDGRGVVTADGSEGAMVSVASPNTIEVAVGEDRYRLPATVQGQTLPAK